jgi:hypothetical protein
MEIFSGKRVFPELTRSAVTFSKTADFVHFVMPARSAGITKWTKSSQYKHVNSHLTRGGWNF